MQTTLFLQSFAQIAQRQPEAIALLNQVYRDLFNEGIQQGCGNCYQKAYYRIQKYLYLQQANSHQDQVLNASHPTRKYLLKPGRSLQTTFGGDTLTNDNLTDAVAEKLLFNHPALLQHFARYPSGEIIENNKTPVTTKTEAQPLSRRAARRINKKQRSK